MTESDQLVEKEPADDCQNRFEQRMASIVQSKTESMKKNLSTVWQLGKFVDEVAQSGRAYGSPSSALIGKQIGLSEEGVEYARRFFLLYDEESANEMARAGLGWREIVALVRVPEFMARDDFKVKLMQKEITWKDVLHSIDLGKKKEKVRLNKEREQASQENAIRRFKENPAGHVHSVLQNRISNIVDSARILDGTWMADERYRASVDTMGFLHRLEILTARHAAVEAIRFYSIRFAELGNHIAARMPHLFPNHTAMTGLPPQADTSRLWHDLHAWTPLPPKGHYKGKGYTTIEKDYRAFHRSMPRLMSIIADVDWVLDQMPKLPDGPGRGLCYTDLAHLYKAIGNMLDKFIDVTNRLTK